MGLSSTVQGLELLQAADIMSEEYRYLRQVMTEVFTRLDGLIRQLQTMAEMEQKWAHELDDVRGGLLQPSAAFFNDFHLQEVGVCLFPCYVSVDFAVQKPQKHLNAFFC